MEKENNKLKQLLEIKQKEIEGLEFKVITIIEK